MGDHQRDELFRKLVGPKVVSAAGDEHRQLEGPKVGDCQQVARRFGRAVGRAGPHGKVLGRSLAGRNGAVHLVRRDNQDPVHPPDPRGFQNALRPLHVGAEKRVRARDGAVHVTLGGEVDEDCGGLPAQ